MSCYTYLLYMSIISWHNIIAKILKRYLDVNIVYVWGLKHKYII